MSSAWLHGRTRDQVLAYDVFKGITAVTLGILLLLIALPAPKKDDGHSDDHSKGKEKPLVPTEIPLKLTFPTPGLTVPKGWWVRVQGSAKPGASVEVAYPDRPVGRSVANKEGWWSVFTQIEDEGPVMARDGSGATTSAVGWTLTEGAPDPDLAVASVAPGARLPAGKNLLSGRASAGSVVLVLFRGLLVGEGKAKDDSTWLIEAMLPEGQGDLIALDGEMSPGSEPVPVVVARDVARLPAFLWTNPLEGARLVDGKLTLQGIGEPGDTVTLYRGGEKVAEVKLDTEGRWELQVDHRRVPTDYAATSAKTGRTVRVPVGVR
ncbi:MAG: hypothetical protein KF884_09850 [Fimbriimonadaceae bacterium]|nr:hypothetical protein [Fimbriimonadaceae bacterium]QYK57849.1 MAG: hypothetical protein KF884_09850 [Fimbriimonadaceae bacterium]